MNLLLGKILGAGLLVSMLMAQTAWDFPEDSTTVGVFVYDFLTSEFEGGALRNFPICDSYDSTGVPLIYSNLPPGDFGWDLFQYPCTEDTVFLGSIDWMGLGSIEIPEVFQPPTAFPMGEQGMVALASLNYFHNLDYAVSDYPRIFVRADSIWLDLANRTVIDQLAEYPLHVLLYLYTPSVGATDYSVAKWIVFVYRNPQDATALIPDDALNEIMPLKATVFPNPFNLQTLLRYQVFTAGKVNIHFYSMHGKLLRSEFRGNQSPGNYSYSYAAGQTASGLILYVVTWNGQTAASGKMLLLK